MEYRTMEKNGRKRTVPIQGRKDNRERQLTAKEMKDLRTVGIRNPGSLTKFGYHMHDSVRERDLALDKAVKKYGQKSVLEKLSDLYRLDYNKPALRSIIVQDLRYVSKGKRSD